MTQYYPSLSSPVPIKNPFRCPPGTEIIIEDIHPVDPKSTKKKSYINKKGILVNSFFRRQEGYSPNKNRQTWADVNIKIDGIILHFSAVRFRRSTMPMSTFYKYLKEGKI
jgi:hypothetical protein